MKRNVFGLYNKLKSKSYLCIEVGYGLIPLWLFNFTYVETVFYTLCNSIQSLGLAVCMKAGLICCKAQKWTFFLRGANGLIILGERQSDQFLQWSVYYPLPFDPFLSGWSQIRVVVPAQVPCLHSFLTCWFYNPKCYIPSHNAITTQRSDLWSADYLFIP